MTVEPKPFSRSRRPTAAGPPAQHENIPRPGQTALSCDQVSIHYGKHVALHEVSVDVHVGEWLAVLGPNGAGKSTLLRAIAGLSPHTGEIALPSGRAPGAADIAVMPQSPMLPEGMSVVEYVLLGRTAHLGWLARESRQDHRIVDSVLHRLGLDDFAHRQVTDLSGGEAQRVVVARSLAQQTPILALDEPTSALDLGHQVQVLELVDDLRRRDGLSVVAAMHDLTTAARFADRLLLLHHGEVVASGSAEVVLRPEILSEVYATPLTVRRLDGEYVVLPAPRSARHPEDRPGGIT
ncbi:MAG: ABC transporter ATP-binding protein [Ornithinimicrobium sp.]